jgi:hypothetical protein
MKVKQLRSLPLMLVAAGGLVVGLAVPAAAHEASHLINGKTIAKNSIPANRLKKHSVTGTQLAPLVWHRVTTFEDGWTNFGSGQARLSYAVDGAGILHLRGVIKNTVEASNLNAVVCSIPSSALPQAVTASVAIGVGGVYAYPATLSVSDGGLAIVTKDPNAAVPAVTETNLNGASLAVR